MCTTQPATTTKRHVYIAKLVCHMKMCDVSLTIFFFVFYFSYNARKNADKFLKWCCLNIIILNPQAYLCGSHHFFGIWATKIGFNTSDKLFKVLLSLVHSFLVIGFGIVIQLWVTRWGQMRFFIPGYIIAEYSGEHCIKNTTTVTVNSCWCAITRELEMENCFLIHTFS